MNTFKAYCGCGFVANNMESAQKHADEKNHVLNIQGVVISDLRTSGRKEVEEKE